MRAVVAPMWKVGALSVQELPRLGGGLIVQKHVSKTVLWLDATWLRRSPLQDPGQRLNSAVGVFCCNPAPENLPLSVGSDHSQPLRPEQPLPRSA
jgi:hypothetical protein